MNESEQDERDNDDSDGAEDAISGLFERGDSESGVVNASEQPGWLVNLRCGHGGEDENEIVRELPGEDEDLCDDRNRADEDMRGSEEEKGSEEADRSVGIDRGSDSGGWVHSGECEEESGRERRGRRGVSDLSGTDRYFILFRSLRGARGKFDFESWFWRRKTAGDFSFFYCFLFHLLRRLRGCFDHDNICDVLG